MPHMSNMAIGTRVAGEGVSPSERENVGAANLLAVATETSDD
jgi:hypothetical protein